MPSSKLAVALVLFCAGCQQLQVPTSPNAVVADSTDVSLPRAVEETRQAGPVTPTPEPAPVPRILEPPRISVPAWQQATLTKIIAGLTETAVAETRKHKGTVVTFEIHGADPSRGASLVGELYDPRGSHSGMGLYLHYWLVDKALSFPDKATLLHALETAVPYKAEVRLKSGEIACCLQKPAIAVTGRFEAEF